MSIAVASAHRERKFSPRSITTALQHGYIWFWMAIFALSYLIASLLAAIVIMPLMLKHLSANEYRDVAAMGQDSFVAAALNSLAFTVPIGRLSSLAISS